MRNTGEHGERPSGKGEVNNKVNLLVALDREFESSPQWQEKSALFAALFLLHYVILTEAIDRGRGILFKV